MAFEYAVALTGSIATGKSTVAKIFSLFGFTVIDADLIAHVLLDEQYEQIEKMFGSQMISTEKKVNRKALGTVIFSDAQKRKELEKFLHPLIYQEIQRVSAQEDRYKKPYFIDIPLFFETKHYPIKKSLVVYTDKETQLKRLMERNRYSKEEAQKRISTQIDVKKKCKFATYIIHNTGDLNVLKEECHKVKEEILGDFR